MTLGGFDGQVQLLNNIFAALTTQPTVLCDTTYSATPPAFDHNDLFNSIGSAAAGSCANFLAGGSNISANPTFVGASDYHLATGSPAIDAGNNAAPALPATDLDGKPRVSGPAVDLGVYEFQQQPPLAATANALPGSTEGGSFSGVVGQFTGGVGPYSASIAWGDGQTSTGTIGAGNSVSGSHAYAEEGSHAVLLTVTDSTAASASATTSATTVDAAISLAGTRLTVRSRTTFTARVATLTDADPGGAASDYGGQIGWGDGSVTGCPRGAKTPWGSFWQRIFKPIIDGQIARYRRTAGNSAPVMMGFPIVLLTTIGAKTGNEHTSVLGGFQDGQDSWIVVASKSGSATHPHWLLNLARNPEQVWLEVGNRRLKVTPTLLKGHERLEALGRVAAIAPRYGGYQEKTDRETPVIRLKAA